jgi:DNA primase
MGLHQAGVPAAVATCGTALTDRHLELVQRAGAREMVFVFDGDAAGLRAAQRASELAAAAAIPARVLVPPGGEDPDETVLRVGVKAFRELISAAQPAIEFLLDRALEKLVRDAPVEARVRTVESVSGIVRAAPTPLAQDLYLEKVAQRIDAPVDAVRLAVLGRKGGSQKPAPKPAPARQAAPAREDSILAKAERQIVGFMLQGADFCEAVERSDALLRFTSASRRMLAEALVAQARGGVFDPEPAVAAVDSDAERAAVLRERSEIQRGGANLKDLDKKLGHYRRIADQVSVQKKISRAQRA